MKFIENAICDVKFKLKFIDLITLQLCLGMIFFKTFSWMGRRRTR